MAKDLMSFLAKNPVDQLEQIVTIPGRLAEFKFKIKPMNAKQFYAYQRVATSFEKGKNLDFNSGKFNELVVINHVIEPNFRDADNLSALGVRTPEEFINKYFLSGELIDLAEKISELSGFNKDDKQLEDEVKNS